MSALSKAFVVLVTFLSVVLVALVVPFVAQTEDLNGQISTQTSRADAAEAKASSAQSEIAAIQADFTSKLQGAQAQVKTLTNQLNEKDAQLSTVRRDLESARQDLVSANASLSGLTATSQQAVALLEGNTQEMTQLRQRELEQAKDNIELTDALQERTAEVGALTRSIRQLREDLASQTQRITELEETLASLPPDVVQTAMISGDSLKPVPDVPIVGMVTAVDTKGDETYVQINVGTNDGVAPNMDFMVHSGEKYKGTVTVSVVDSAEAAGTLVISAGDIQPGDSVFAGEL